jgi:hypothetical protein
MRERFRCSKRPSCTLGRKRCKKTMENQGDAAYIRGEVFTTSVPVNVNVLQSWRSPCLTGVSKTISHHKTAMADEFVRKEDKCLPTL